MYYSYPCNHFRQQMNQGVQQPFNQMPTMPMQPMQPMMPMGQMGTMDQFGPMGQMGTMGENVGATLGGGMGVPPIAGPATPFGTTTGTQPTNIASVPIGAGTIEQPVWDTQFTQGYLRTQIGKRVKVEFLIGTNMLVDREGTLIDVGISYIIINEVETDDLLLCDIYSIKFVRFYF